MLSLIAVQFSFSYAQACGKSERTISLKFGQKVKPLKKVSYELFYLAPKGTGAEYNNPERTGKFLLPFLDEKFVPNNNYFWENYKEESPFIKMPSTKAEKYLKTYKLLDFKDFYTNQWHDNHLPQLKGNFNNGILKLETRETDITPFIMRIKAPKFETLYLVSSFLGGCFNGAPTQTIEMSLLKKK